MRIIQLVLAGLGAAFAVAGNAHEPAAPVDQVQLTTTALRQVDTDRVAVVLYKDHQAQEQATAANEVNRAIAWATDAIKAAGLRAETTTYRSTPIYRKSQMIGWRVLQKLRVETDDSETLAKLLATLQTRVAVQSLEHVLSASARAAVEDGLLEEALEAFRRRADLVARSFGRDGHRVLSIAINTSVGGGPRPVPMARAGSVSSEAQSMASPVIDGGAQRVQVTVSGSVQMTPAQ